jgi:hypothetical protein
MPHQTWDDRSQLYRLLEARIEGTLLDFVLARWPHTGWRKISDELKALTGITVGHETLRRWFGDRIAVEVTTTVRDDAPASAA